MHLGKVGRQGALFCRRESPAAGLASGASRVHLAAATVAGIHVACAGPHRVRRRRHGLRPGVVEATAIPRTLRGFHSPHLRTRPSPGHLQLPRRRRGHPRGKPLPYLPWKVARQRTRRIPYGMAWPTPSSRGNAKRPERCGRWRRPRPVHFVPHHPTTYRASCPMRRPTDRS
jgi:hypothetical protein